MTDDRYNPLVLTRFNIVVLVLSFILLVSLIFKLNIQDKDVVRLRDELKVLEQQKANLLKESKIVTEENIVVKKEVIEDVSGLSISMIDNDTRLASEFFDLAFNWQTSEQYDIARKFYIDSLGDNNSFTKKYLPPQIRVKSEMGVISQIDYYEMKAKLDDIVVVPMKRDGDKIDYTAIVNYYVYKDKRDLGDTRDLKSSKAIIKFTVDGADGNRKVMKADATSGYDTNN